MTSHDYPSKEVIADSTARMLLEIGAVRFRADQPFMFTSGLASPVYIDCRKVISHPQVREKMMSFASSLLLRDVGLDQFDTVAGGETAGIPFAAWIAADLGLPMQYVRKKPKGYARDAQVEGDITPGQRVLLVEDLTTDGASKIKFCEALRRAGARVDHTVMIFFYDIFPETRTRLAEHNLTLHSLATWRDVLRVSKESTYFDPTTLAEVESFLGNPFKWSGDHGGATTLSL
ncbi:orotate phosphoribosyltransferase [Thalassobius vesicularis]|uniref:Orotate phosphoribosyltransferase n=1 Tax=Thalassobius vesicularis TaxID=1294297 RepID=A0A4S3MBZ1_9RHOB|nr:orotate phosphoribosyltransferase [Thalassobius vesicularis]THD76283.1 orotate phosphoribosyltransferase [Thalassobius vesicularis]